MEAWHAYVGGTGAAGILIGLGKWMFSQFNGKADRSKVEKIEEELAAKTDRATTKLLFEKLERHADDISGLKENTAVTRTKVEGIEGAVGRIEDKLGRALNR